MTPAPISVERLREIVAFLLGEGRLDGHSFGDGFAPLVAGKYPAVYWWRTQLREQAEALPALLHQLAEREAEVERLREELDVANTSLGQATTDCVKQSFRAEAAERAREEATGLLREIYDTIVLAKPIAPKPVNLADRIAAFLAASGEVVTHGLDASSVVTHEVTVRHNDDGSLDEVVGSGQFHLEQMDYNKWWMQLGPHMVTLTARGKISAWFGKNEAATPASGGPRDG